MVSRSFKIKKAEFERVPLKVLQHKLRTLMKCYTIRDLELNEINQTLRFKKTYRINGIKMQDPSQCEGCYETQNTENPKEIILKISI